MNRPANKKAGTLLTIRDGTTQRLVSDDGTRMRHWTRTELERLQTLPEGYTSTISVNQAHHALGNGWTVDVITHIFKGIVAESERKCP